MPIGKKEKSTQQKKKIKQQEFYQFESHIKKTSSQDN
jgi:hypothetical protein